MKVNERRNYEILKELVQKLNEKLAFFVKKQIMGRSFDNYFTTINLYTNLNLSDERNKTITYDYNLQTPAIRS